MSLLKAHLSWKLLLSAGFVLLILGKILLGSPFNLCAFGVIGACLAQAFDGQSLSLVLIGSYMSLIGMIIIPLGIIDFIRSRYQP